MTKIDKSVLTFGITIFLKFMLFDILWCIPTTFASLSTVECYTTKLIATLILLIPYAFFRMWKTETLIMFLLDFLLIANLMYFRTYYTAIPLNSYGLSGNLADFTGSVFDSFRWYDILFPLSTLAAAVVHRRTKTAHQKRPAPVLAYSVVLAVIICIFGTVTLIKGGFSNAYKEYRDKAYFCSSGPSLYTVFGSLCYDLAGQQQKLTPELEAKIEEWLSKEAGRKVEIKSPKKGEKLRFVEMADNNAKITLDNKEKDKSEILVELKEVLGLDKLPRKIETYDISNISGEYIVAGMCVMIDGVIKRNMSRRFKIKTIYGQDDPRCMEEVITRRLKHSINANSNGFGRLPDVIFADGGITQIRATKTAIAKYELNIPVFGMVKNNKHQTRALMDENRQELQISDNLKNLITKFQDEVHDTAISYHRKLRDSAITKSELDGIVGIGEMRKKALLKHFGSVEKIRDSSIEELTKISGINEDLAKDILRYTNGNIMP